MIYKKLTGSNIMDLNELISNFADQFDETDASEINSDTDFKALDEWSSMTGLAVIAMVDAEYDVQIKGNDIRESGPAVC